MESKCTVFVSGLFNVLHPGHLRFLDFAKRQGDLLIVGIIRQTNFQKSSLSDEERLKNIKAIVCVDDVFIVDDLEKTLLKLKPDIIVKGWEFRDQYNIESGIVASFGGKMIFSPNDISTSLSNINSAQTLFGIITRQAFKDFEKRRNISDDELHNILNSIPDIKTCVLGDIIIDKYVHCDAVGMSREDPCIVMKPEKNQYYIGGAAIVARHAQSLGANVHFISAGGEDELCNYCENELKKNGITTTIIRDKSRPTTEKTRFKVDGKTLARVNNFSDHSISSAMQEQIFASFEEIAQNLDLVIFSDFSYGVLPAKLVARIIAKCKENNIFISADSQSSSQIGNLSYFHGVDFISPTEYEARVTLSDSESGLVELSKKINKFLHIPKVVLTLGADGTLMTEFNKKTEAKSFENDSLPALNPFPKDVSGAGDAFIVMSSLVMSLKYSIWYASLLGSIASGIQVSREGNIPIKASDIIEIIKK